MLTKLSLLLFFTRVFPIRKVIILAWVLFATVLVSHTVFLFLLLFQCVSIFLQIQNKWFLTSQVPVRGVWENWKYTSPPIKCLDAYTLVYVAGGFGVVLDTLILAFPLPIIWNLKLAWNKKIHLTVIFCIGIFVIACGSARLPTLKHMKDSSDMSCKLSYSPRLWPNTHTNRVSATRRYLEWSGTFGRYDLWLSSSL